MTLLSKIAIHGVPRSGTSWLGEIFNSSPNTIYKFQPLFSYELKDYLSPYSSENKINEFFSVLSQTSSDFLDQKEKRKKDIFPQFFKNEITHIVYKEVRYHHILPNLLAKTDDALFVFIIRNPLSTINSWLNTSREFRTDLGWSPLKEWRYAEKKNEGRPEEFNGYEKWKEATRLFMDLNRKYPDRTYLLKYEDLLKDPLAEVEAVFDFCHLAMTSQTTEFLTESQQKNHEHEYSVFRKDHDNGKWRNQLDGSISEFIINDLNGTELEVFLQ